MTDLLASTLTHLEALVSFDTRNRPRAIAAEGGIFDYLRAQLPGFQVEVIDRSAGAVVPSAESFSRSQILFSRSQIPFSRLQIPFSRLREKVARSAG